MKAINEAMKKLQESKMIKESAVRDEFEAGMKQYLSGGEGRSRDDIKVLAETDYYMLTGSVDSEDPNIINLSVIGSYRRVQVFIDQDYKGKVESAKVNWSAIGSVGIEEAREFMKHIDDAIKFIEEIDGKDFASEIRG